MAKRDEKAARLRALILGILGKTKDGLTITDISRISKLHYITSSKYLAVLEAENRITRRDIGMAKLYKIKEGGKNEN